MVLTGMRYEGNPLNGGSIPLTRSFTYENRARIAPLARKSDIVQFCRSIPGLPSINNVKVGFRSLYRPTFVLNSRCCNWQADWSFTCASIRADSPLYYELKLLL